MKKLGVFIEGPVLQHWILQIHICDYWRHLDNSRGHGGCKSFLSRIYYGMIFITNFATFWDPHFCDEKLGVS
ncbi:hypothetical protein JTB14_035159 [Gonioctena quinquepunctata]|nr:hypothetical protein JTB14_035159 [Gonioctena quinquepunctata]